MRIKKALWGIAAMLFMSATVVSFQNCPGPRLARTTAHLQSSIEGTFCSTSSAVGLGQVKLVFIIDMSISNYGGFSNGVFQDGGNDPKMKRLTAIKKAINKCGTPNVQYALVGFEDEAFEPAGGTAFVDAKTAKEQIQVFMERQEKRKKDAKQVTGSFSSGTAFLPPLRIAKKLITKDIVADPITAKATTYLVFMLTDGIPTDLPTSYVMPGASPTTDLCPKMNTAWKDTIDEMIIEGYGATAGLRLQPILYQDPIFVNNPADQAKAQCILDKLGAWGNSKTVPKLNVGSMNFCNLLDSPALTYFRRTGFGIINLNAIPQQGQLLADSDSDGISDGEESDLGLDPTLARSNGKVLDHVCRMIEGGTNCAPACDSSQFLPLGLNNCDILSLQLPATYKSYDADNDHIPDFIEILKGTYPTADDANENPDNDDLRNLAEILEGRNPRYPDSDMSSKYKVIADIESAGSCDTDKERWTFVISQMPVVPTLKVVVPQVVPPGTPPAFDFSHEAGENLVLIFYETEATNVSVGAPPKSLWGVVKKVGPGSQNLNILESDFIKLGDMP